MAAVYENLFTVLPRILAALHPGYLLVDAVNLRRPVQALLQAVQIQT
ncbi:hypothetical protein HNQ50_002918 [Silvimonas terrae]|uniref:Uncharacterized protein n=1 Tax=Silvimonas terrae TaxID=300266 RepID=A0A840RJ48_9NEIS|nr:hypothetical protein [Silvimonas terrae]MBB5192181.1 hypothetical protein [Silvimonas terrae]